MSSTDAKSWSDEDQVLYDTLVMEGVALDAEAAGKRREAEAKFAEAALIVDKYKKKA